ncbi:MAG: enhanced serine sensitivity protein SseB [Oscillospiraceae bacterium]|nr:enhanced serine sensitivity protein SseB [Oscillospiraceae bacterium]
MDIKNFHNGLDVDGAADEIKATNDASLVKGFFEKAQNSDFLVPYRDNLNTFPLLEVKEKGKMLPAFASYEAFEKSPLPKDRARVMPFAEIDKIVKSSGGRIAGIIINPHGKSMIFQHNGANPGGNSNGKDVKLMKPASVPESIAAALHGFFTAAGNVYSAYILWAQKEGDLVPHLFLVIDFDGTREEFFPKAAEAIRPSLKAGDNVEMAKADFKLLTAAEKLVKPFYKKS